MAARIVLCLGATVLGPVDSKSSESSSFCAISSIARVPMRAAANSMTYLVRSLLSGIVVGRRPLAPGEAARLPAPRIRGLRSIGVAHVPPVGPQQCSLAAGEAHEALEGVV